MRSIFAFLVINIILCCFSTETRAQNSAASFAPLSIEFDNIVGNQNLALNTGSYLNASGETFTISRLQYYISNFILRMVDGTEYTVPQDSSYFLINENDPATRFARLNVPVGDYTSISFILGVDSLRATMDLSKRKGVLDVAGGMEDGMFWGWTMGYIFFKLEGNSDVAPVDPLGLHKFRYHIGGFGNTDPASVNNIKTIRVDLKPEAIAKVRQGRKSNVHLKVDISKVFDGQQPVSIASHPAIMFSKISKQVVANYATMFSHDHTEN